MRVDPRLHTSPAGPIARREGPAGARRFAPAGGEGAQRPSGPLASAPLATLDALLALQGEGNDTGERRRRSLRRGHDLLDRLDRLKAQLLSGRVPTADLKRLTSELRQREGVTGDPVLDEIIGHIELRAEVELAKLAGAER